MNTIAPYDKFLQLALKNGRLVFNLPPTGQKTSYIDYDDGYYQKGKKLSGTRFTDLGDGSVLDNCTGLIWLKDPSAWAAFGDAPGYPKYLMWQETIAACKNFIAQGQSDWTVPTIYEMQSVLNYGNANPAIGEETRGNYGSQLPFANLWNFIYWSSTTDTTTTTKAWCCDMVSGWFAKLPKTGGYFVLPVRRITKETT